MALQFRAHLLLTLLVHVVAVQVKLVVFWIVVGLQLKLFTYKSMRRYEQGGKITIL